MNTDPAHNASAGSLQKSDPRSLLSADLQHLDARIVTALQARPVPAISLGFAKRVARAATTQASNVPSAHIRWGFRAALVGAAILLVAMFCLAFATQRHPQLGTSALLMQTLYLGEFALAIYGAIRFRSLI